MLFPKKKKYNISLVDTTEMIISEKEEDSDFYGINMSDVINHAKRIKNNFNK